jgi:hypothetical protein
VYNSWSFFNLQSSSDSRISLKDLYRNWFIAHCKKSLTPSQQFWQSKFSVNFDEIWKIIHYFRNAPRLKNLLWRIYSKTLPLYKGNHPLALCDYCSKPESTIHLFFECERSLHIIELIRPYWEDWLGLTLNWSPSSILPLKSHKHQRMFLVLVAEYNFQRERYLSKLPKFPPTLSPSQTLNSKSSFPLHLFTFHFLIPYHFLITNSNTVIPVDSNLK